MKKKKFLSSRIITLWRYASTSQAVKKIDFGDLLVAKVVRFYGLTFKEVYELKTYEFSKLAQSMEILEAKEMLRDMKISIYPHLKKEAKKDLRDSIAKKANKLERENAPQLSGAEIAKALGL